MSNFFYELVDTSTIRLWQRLKTFTKSDLQQDSTDIDDLLALTSNEKELIISGSKAYKSVEDFDNQMQLKKQKIDEIISYWDYNTTSTSFDRITGNYVSPDSVYDKCGEDATNVAENSIDELTGTYWQHDVNELHWIVYDLGRSLQNITQIRIAIGGSDSDAHKLSGVDVYVTDDLNDFGSAVATGLNFQTLGAWNQHSLTPKQGRYIRLENIDTLDVNNYLRIREVEFTHQISGF